MNERPILFSAPMVRAILDGRKTMTRRVINMDKLRGVLPRPVHGDWMFANVEAKAGVHKLTANPQFAVCADLGAQQLGLRPGEFNFIVPYCGECTTVCDDNVWRLRPKQEAFLWVRETWGRWDVSSGGGCRLAYAATDTKPEFIDTEYCWAGRRA